MTSREDGGGGCEGVGGERREAGMGVSVGDDGGETTRVKGGESGVAAREGIGEGVTESEGVESSEVLVEDGEK